jgi:hypothetical protein
LRPSQLVEDEETVEDIKEEEEEGEKKNYSFVCYG